MRVPMAEQVSPRSAQNTQDVVLRGSNAPVPRLEVESAVQRVGGAQQIEQRLFFDAGERLFLHDFEFQASHFQSPGTSAVSSGHV
ncbi:MAG: hypothetical protein ABR987_21615 [Terracidiphilus sp.]